MIGMPTIAKSVLFPVKNSAKKIPHIGKSGRKSRRFEIKIR
jgi:hypothetical protein